MLKKKKSLRELQSRSKMICEYGTFKLHVIIFVDIKVLITTFSYRNYCGCGVICTILQEKEKKISNHHPSFTDDQTHDYKHLTRI